MPDTLTDRLSALAHRVDRWWHRTHHRDTDPACLYYSPTRRAARAWAHGRACQVCMRSRLRAQAARWAAGLDTYQARPIRFEPTPFYELTPDLALRLRTIYGPLVRGPLPTIQVVTA